jgi:hypothetical protein
MYKASFKTENGTPVLRRQLLGKEVTLSNYEAYKKAMLDLKKEDNKARTMIDDDNLLLLFRDMPKGGNLHIHTSATLQASTFVEMLRKTPTSTAAWNTWK